MHSDPFEMNLASFEIRANIWASMKGNAYHNPKHLRDIWYLVGEHDHEFSDDTCSLNKEIPLWYVTMFHDIVYLPGLPAGENEKKSAEVFDSLSSKMVMCLDHKQEIIDVILATADHTNPDNMKLPSWGKHFLDFDLWGLSSPWEVFSENTRNIVAELAPYYTMQQIIESRTKWLNYMLSRPKLYWMYPDRETLARNNMERELKNIHELEIYERI